jgi:hypothetical protein
VVSGCAATWLSWRFSFVIVFVVVAAADWVTAVSVDPKKITEDDVLLSYL